MLNPLLQPFIIVVAVIFYGYLISLSFLYLDWLHRMFKLIPSVLKWLSMISLVTVFGFLWGTTSCELFHNRLILSIMTLGMLAPSWFAIVFLVLPRTDERSSNWTKLATISVILTSITPLTFFYFDHQTRSMEQFQAYQSNLTE